MSKINNNILFSSDKTYKKLKSKQTKYRPFTSIPSRTSFPSSNSENFAFSDKRNIKYIVENNLYENINPKNTKITITRNNYNQLNKNDLIGKDKYSNFTVFIKREMSQRLNRNIPRNITKKLKRQGSAIQLNPTKIFRGEGNLYLTDILIKKLLLKPRNFSSNNVQKKKINFFAKIRQNFNNRNFNEKNDLNIINNHKYENINILRKIEVQKNLKKNKNIEEGKNSYLIDKKLEYISINQKKSKTVCNYKQNMENFIKNQYSNKLKSEKLKINSEEKRNQILYINDKIKTIKISNDLYNNIFLNKFHDYVKFLWKKVDQYDKRNYFLLNEIFVLQKNVNKLKQRINKLSEEKKIYNKFIILQICLQRKTSKLPDYYEYILNHALSESIQFYNGILEENQVKEIYGYRNKIIYKNYETFNHQFKAYENENRDLLKKLGILKKEINKLNDERNKLIEEEKQITHYLNEKIKEKTNEKISIINKYKLLINEKNNLLSEIKYSFSNVNESKIHQKKLISKYNSLYNDNIETSYKSNNSNITSNFSEFNIDAINSKKTKTERKKKYSTKNIKPIYETPFMTPSTPPSLPSPHGQEKEKLHHLSDEGFFLNFNIMYENKDKNVAHSKIYFKVRKLFFLLKHEIKKDDYFLKAGKILSENGLILTLLSKIEEAMNIFLERKRELSKNNIELVSKLKQKMEKKRKIMKGKEHKAIVKAKYENMKKKVENKAKKIYFLPKNKKRTVSAFINKKSKNKKIKKVVEKSEYELLVEYFKEN